ncbi:alanine racemase [Sporolactobacillus shoreicorticis]|uniref:Alanine racemase n=1 Tax=Sporolactobacillus shoreicorticis TaxID=1923877 RepID=A0ABW5S747_9BACL|nr:alanine racemase [Sporolactobacillus shoreicorticis]MCO7128221.1 alanine racemase [Sporolactobacillus shoreicorticis]
MTAASYYRETWADIDLDAVAINVRNMKKRIPEDVALLAVVKANGYGHGALQIAQTALDNGASWLAVALFDEALALRKQGIEAPILVLSPVPPQHAGLAAKNHIALTVSDGQWVKRARESYTAKEPVFLHLSCDTGMGRIGIRSRDEASAFVAEIGRDPCFVIEGMFTHFATADQDDEAYFNEQYTRFEMMVDWIQELGVRPAVIHCGNSATTLKYPAEKRHLFNLVRYGIAMYGLSPSQEMVKQLPFELKRAMSLHSRLTYVKQVEKGSFIGYGATYQSSKDEWIGTVPIGYADGWLRGLQGTDVLIDGQRCPIVGRICMDQFMCRLPQAYPEGTEVTLIGKNGAEEVTADERARQLQTINYEVTCMIHPRVPRVYWKNSEKIATSNPILSAADET